MSKVDLHCPQCGYDSQGPPQRAVECGRCETLLVNLGGTTKAAREFDGRSFPSEKDTLALVCRVCGAPWPIEVTKSPTGAECSYCGHPAELPPTLRAILKVTATHPAALPPSIRAFHLQWAFIAALFVVVAVLHFTLPSRALDAEDTLQLTNTTFVESTPDGDRYKLSVVTPTVNVQLTANSFLHAVIKAYEFDTAGKEVIERILIPNSELRLRVAAVEEATGAERESWIKLWHKPPPGKNKEDPESHPYAQVPLAKGWDVATWPPGKYHIVIKEAIVRGGSLPPKLHVEWSSMVMNANGLIILVVNILLWLALFDLWRSNRHRFRKPSVSWVAALALLLCGILLVDVLHPLPYFHTTGQFTPVSVR